MLQVQQEAVLAPTSQESQKTLPVQGCNFPSGALCSYSLVLAKIHGRHLLISHCVQNTVCAALSNLQLHWVVRNQVELRSARTARPAALSSFRFGNLCDTRKQCNTWELLLLNWQWQIVVMTSWQLNINILMLKMLKHYQSHSPYRTKLNSCSVVLISHASFSEPENQNLFMFGTPKNVLMQRKDFLSNGKYNNSPPRRFSARALRADTASLIFHASSCFFRNWRRRRFWAGVDGGGRSSLSVWSQENTTSVDIVVFFVYFCWVCFDSVICTQRALSSLWSQLIPEVVTSLTV